MAIAVRDRISTAGWAALSGYVVHSCGRLASGQLSTCHETVEPRWACRGSDRGEPDIGSTVSPNSQSRGPDRISTAGWAVLSGHVDHPCGKLASGQLSTCHETVEPRWACRGSDRGAPDIGSTVSSNSQCADQTASQRLVKRSSAGMSIIPAANWRRGSSAHVTRL